MLCLLLLVGAARAASPCVAPQASASAPPVAAAPAGHASADDRLLDGSDSIDGVTRLIAARLAWMPAVAAWKWQHHVPISDPVRERAVIQHAADVARSMGLDPDAVEKLFEWQTAEARGLEAQCEREWQHAGFRYPRPVPDLAGELRPTLDALTAAQLRALYVAAPFLPAGVQALRGSLSRALSGRRAASREDLALVLALVHLIAQPTLARSRAAGVLRVGTTGDYAPFSIARERHVHGVDIDLARALAQQLGLQAVFVRTTWPSLLTDLAADRFDLAMGGIADTSGRRAAAAVSIGYLAGGKTIIARCVDAARWRSLADLDHPGVRVIVNPGGTNEQFVRAALHRAQVRLYPDNTTIFEEIRAGRADAMITDDFEVELQQRRHPELCRTFPGVLTHAEKVVLLGPDPELRISVNQWLASALHSGLPGELLRQALAAP